MTNKEVLKMADIERELYRTIWIRQLMFSGQVMKEKDLKEIGSINEEKSQGKARTKLLVSYNE